MEFPKVYVIIVWYNGAKWVQRNIESLLQSVIPARIICIDNQSTDQTAALLQRYADRVTVIQAPCNLGFGKANNIGLDLALKEQADYVFLLNQDTWIYPETLLKLVEVAANNPNYGIVSPIHLSANETDWDVNFKTYAARAIHKQPDLLEVPFVNAAAWLLPLAALQRVSYFEPLFGHYGEDRNFVDRIQFHNFKVGITPLASITHDRVITRNFKKDVVQCQYKILAILLNPNLSPQQAKQIALKNAFGLPKYFYKFYGFSLSVQLFFTLIAYYIKQLCNWPSIKKARNSY